MKGVYMYPMRFFVFPIWHSQGCITFETKAGWIQRYVVADLVSCKLFLIDSPWKVTKSLSQNGDISHSLG
jgi:hypothetical protein